MQFGRRFHAAAAPARAAPAAAVAARGPGGLRQRRGCAAVAGARADVGALRGAEPSSGTRLGAYLEACGAIWADASQVHDVVASEDGRRVTWRVDLPPERLATLRPGDPLESPPFEFGGEGTRARLQLFPKGDYGASGEGVCSLWLCTDDRALAPVRLRLGDTERPGGSSDFARLEDVLRDGVLEVGLEMADDSPSTSVQGPIVQQSLQMTGLEVAEWRLFNVDKLLKDRRLFSSPPFRFHHVLLGDMYLELRPGVPYEEHCVLFFRCRVPRMRLRVHLEVGGGAFAKSFEAMGRSNEELDLKDGRCLQVNLSAPNVLDASGALLVRASLEEVVAVPNTLQDLIRRQDERASWPKRL